MIIVLYHPEMDCIELWDDSGRPFYSHDIMMHRSVWSKLECAMERGWEVVGTL